MGFFKFFKDTLHLFNQKRGDSFHIATPIALTKPRVQRPNSGTSPASKEQKRQKKARRIMRRQGDDL